MRPQRRCSRCIPARGRSRSRRRTPPLPASGAASARALATGSARSGALCPGSRTSRTTSAHRHGRLTGEPALQSDSDARVAGAPQHLVPDRDVPRRDPVRLEEHHVVVGLPPGISPATMSWSSCTSSQSSWPAATGSIRSPDSSFASSSASQQTSVARVITCASSSRGRGSLAPIAQTSAPSRSQSPRRTGSRDVVAVTTMSQAPAADGDSATVAPCASANARARSGVRLETTIRSMVGTAARTAASCDSACQPAPNRPRLAAPGRARCFAATPVAAPVRTCPSRSAAMSAVSEPSTRSKRQTTNVEPSLDGRVALEPARRRAPDPRQPSRRRRRRRWGTAAGASARPRRRPSGGSSPRSRAPRRRV